MSGRWRFGPNRARLLVVLAVAATSLGVVPAVSAYASGARSRVAVQQATGAYGSPEVRLPAGAVPSASSPGHSPVPVFSSAYAVSCPSSSYCLAVGAYNANDVVKVLTELWTGTAWSVLRSPGPDNAASSVLNAISCPSASHCLAVGSYTDTSGTTWGLSELWTGSSWSILDSPVPTGGTFVGLSGVSCASASYCVAVGSYTNSRAIPVTLIEVWDGSSWSIVHSPNPNGGRNSGLSSVSCASESACMATGYTNGSDFVRVTLAESWNGSSWSIVESPNPDGAQGSFLNGVSCPSAMRCRAVGGYFDSDFVAETLAESWNGSRWSVVDSPNPPRSPSSDLYSISCATASRCLAVGDSYSPSRAAKDGTLVESWNGSSWSIVGSPSPSTTSFLYGISCATADDCLAVGAFFNRSSNYQTLAEAWNGRSFAIVNQDADLAGISCLSATFCVAVGSYVSRSVSVTLAEEWNGTTWRLVPTPDPVQSEGSYLSAITCVRIDRCVAVGYYYKPDNSRVTLVESWNGVYWSIVPSPNPLGAAYSVLYGISCTGTSQCMAVGSAAGRVLGERWDGSHWSIVPTSDPDATAYGELTGIHCASAVHCLAVGYETDTHYHADVTLAEKWNGSAWSIVPSAAPGEDFFRSSLLHGISCSAAAGCLAVGERELPSGTYATLTERWTGTRWDVLASPSPSGSIFSELSAISCIGTGQCLAVGNSFNDSGNFVPLTERWTGSQWRIVQPGFAALQSGISYLLGVSCTSSFTCWATGAHGDPANRYPLRQRWDGSARRTLPQGRTQVS